MGKINKNIQEKLKPRSFYVELAEMGLLEEFLKLQMRDEYENNPDFRREMLDILYKHSPNKVQDIEILHLEKLCESLSYFLEYTKRWTKQNQ